MRLSNGRVWVGSSGPKNSRVRVGYANMQVLDHSLVYIYKDKCPTGYQDFCSSGLLAFRLVAVWTSSLPTSGHLDIQTSGLQT